MRKLPRDGKVRLIITKDDQSKMEELEDAGDFDEDSQQIHEEGLSKKERAEERRDRAELKLQLRRIKAVKLAAKGCYSYEELSEQLNVAKSRLQIWFAWYRKEGFSGLLRNRRKSPRRVPTKGNAIWVLVGAILSGKYKQGAQMRDLLVSHGCHVSLATVNRWRSFWREKTNANEKLTMQIYDFMCATGLLLHIESPTHPEVKRAVAIVKEFKAKLAAN